MAVATFGLGHLDMATHICPLSHDQSGHSADRQDSAGKMIGQDRRGAGGRILIRVIPKGTQPRDRLGTRAVANPIRPRTL